MEMYNFCKVFLVLICLLNGFNCVFGVDETPIGSTNKTLVPKVDEKTMNGCNEMDSSLRTDCRPKSRRKRYIAFPEGSSFSVNFFFEILSVFEIK